MMCETCGHEHQETEIPVSHKSIDTFGNKTYGYRMEPTHQFCAECPCVDLNPTDYEDRLALIAAGEIDGD